MTDQVARHENIGHEIVRYEIVTHFTSIDITVIINFVRHYPAPPP